jgi:hypothetical protein
MRANKITAFAKYSVLTAFFILISAHARSQCNSPSGQPSLLCQDATITWLNNACYTTVNESDQGHSGFCGAGTLVHNPQYFLFIASDTIVTLDIAIK